MQQYLTMRIKNTEHDMEVNENKPKRYKNKHNNSTPV